MKHRMVSAREIVGKRIVAFAPNTTPGLSNTGGPAHNPRIILDDGSVLVFITEELRDGADYGTLILRVKRTETEK